MPRGFSTCRPTMSGCHYGSVGPVGGRVKEEKEKKTSPPQERKGRGEGGGRKR